MIARHWLEDHKEEEEIPQFYFKILSRHSSALARQVEEAILISNSEDELINNKEESLRNCLPRLSFEGMKEKCDSVEWRTRIEEAKKRLKRNGEKRLYGNTEDDEEEEIEKKRNPPKKARKRRY